MNNLAENPKTRFATLIAVFATALLIRAVAVIGLSGSLAADPDAYRKLAENIATRGVYTTTGEPTAFRPPLYPLLLAPTVADGEVSSTGVALLHVLLGAATVLLTFVFAEQCGLKHGAFLAAGLVAIDPILLNQSAQVMTETLATLLAIAGMVALGKLDEDATIGRAALAGGVLALAGLCRPTFLPWLGLAGISVLGGPKVAWSNMKYVATLFLVAIVVIAPWAIRNFLVLGKPKLTTTHGGYTVMLGNNPSFYRYLRESKAGETWDAKLLARAWQWRRLSDSPDDRIWDLIDSEEAARQLHESGKDYSAITRRDEPLVRTEFEDDAFAYSLARRYISEEPGMFVYSCFVRVGRLWQLFPYATGESESTLRRLLRTMTGLWYLALFVLAIFGAIVRRRELLRSPLMWGLLLCFAFTAVHALYWSNMRMRAPLMPFVCVLACLGMAKFAERWRSRKP